MLSIFVCEDKDDQRENITTCIHNYIFMEGLHMDVVCSTPNPHDVIKYLQENEGKVAGLYFLDIDLECDMNGIKLASAIREYDPRGFIVFITADAHSHILTFQYKVEAMDYIVKDSENLRDRICECIGDAYNRYISKTTPLQNNYVFSVSRGNVVAVDKSKILFVETTPGLPHFLTIHAENEMHQFRGKLSKVLRELKNDFFIKCHRSIIVNSKKVVHVDNQQLKLTMDNGLEIDISDKYMRRVKKYVKITPQALPQS